MKYKAAVSTKGLVCSRLGIGRRDLDKLFGSPRYAAGNNKHFNPRPIGQLFNRCKLRSVNLRVDALRSVYQ